MCVDLTLCCASHCKNSGQSGLLQPCLCMSPAWGHEVKSRLNCNLARFLLYHTDLPKCLTSGFNYFASKSPLRWGREGNRELCGVWRTDCGLLL